jgi:hypothetical protein
MRVFFTCTVATADALLRDGWTNRINRDCHGLNGVHLSDRRLDANDGFPGPVVLCLEVPDNVLEQYGWGEEVGGLFCYAVIPADVLKTIGPPQIYDHRLAGDSRKELLDAIRFWEQEFDESLNESSRERAEELREALKFMDRHGWQTVLLRELRLREEGN